MKTTEDAPFSIMALERIINERKEDFQETNRILSKMVICDSEDRQVIVNLQKEFA